MEYRIRTAVPADEARIRELFLEMLRTIYHTNDVKGYGDEDLDRFWRKSLDRIYVAEDGQVVAFLSVEFHHDPINHRRWISAFVGGVHGSIVAPAAAPAASAATSNPGDAPFTDDVSFLIQEVEDIVFQAPCVNSLGCGAFQALHCAVDGFDVVLQADDIVVVFCPQAALFF